MIDIFETQYSRHKALTSPGGPPLQPSCGRAPAPSPVGADAPPLTGRFIPPGYTRAVETGAQPASHPSQAEPVASPRGVSSPGATGAQSIDGGAR